MLPHTVKWGKYCLSYDGSVAVTDAGRNTATPSTKKSKSPIKSKSTKKRLGSSSESQQRQPSKRSVGLSETESPAATPTLYSPPRKVYTKKFKRASKAPTLARIHEMSPEYPTRPRKAPKRKHEGVETTPVSSKQPKFGCRLC